MKQQAFYFLQQEAGNDQRTDFSMKLPAGHLPVLGGDRCCSRNVSTCRVRLATPCQWLGALAFPTLKKKADSMRQTASPENSFQSPQDRHVSSVHPGCLVHHSPPMELSTRLATHGHPHSMSIRTEFGQGMTEGRTQVDTRCERNHKTRLTSSTSDQEVDKHFFMRKQMLYFKMESSRLKSPVRVCLQCKEVFEKLLLLTSLMIL